MSKLKPFTIDYNYNGKKWCMELEAESFEDAEARLRAAYFNGEAMEVVATIPFDRPFRFLTWLNNLLKKVF